MSSMCGHNERNFRTTCSQRRVSRSSAGELKVTSRGHEFEKRLAQEEQQRVQDPRQSRRMHRHQREKQMMKRLRRIHSQRRGKQRTLPCLVCKSEDQAARDLLQSVPSRRSKESWYRQKYRKSRGTPLRHGDQSIESGNRGQKTARSLDTDKRELQRLARNSVEHFFRDKQVEVSDALIDEVGALLTERGGAQIIETFPPDRFAAKAGDLGLRPGFAIDLCENKPYGPYEGEPWDLSKNSDVKELFEMIAFEQPMVVTGSPLCTAFFSIS